MCKSVGFRCIRLLFFHQEIYIFCIRFLLFCIRCSALVKPEPGERRHERSCHLLPRRGRTDPASQRPVASNPLRGEGIWREIPTAVATCCQGAADTCRDVYNGRHNGRFPLLRVSGQLGRCALKDTTDNFPPPSKAVWDVYSGRCLQLPRDPQQGHRHRGQYAVDS